MKPYQLFAVIQAGLESFGEQELRELGVANFEAQPGGFAFAGHLTTVMRLHLRMRVFSRLLLELASFRAETFRQLHAGLEAIDWSPFLAGHRLRVRVHSYRSKLFHETAVAERLLKIAPHNPVGANEQLVIVTIRDNVARVSLDASGDHLHKRGWCAWRGEAPLRETLAAAMLRAAGWNTGGALLVDPFCGSGAIVLEACAMRLNTPLHENRSFAFQTWPCFRADLWRKAIEELPVAQSAPFRAQGRDIDPRAVETARHNAQAMGVEAYADFAEGDFADYRPEPGALVVTNPPWGVRLPAQRALWERISRLNTSGADVLALGPASLARRLNAEVAFTSRSGVHDLAAMRWRPRG